MPACLKKNTQNTRKSARKRTENDYGNNKENCPELNREKYRENPKKVAGGVARRDFQSNGRKLPAKANREWQTFRR